VQDVTGYVDKYVLSFFLSCALSVLGSKIRCGMHAYVPQKSCFRMDLPAPPTSETGDLGHLSARGNR
jgi:hypothetical protein